MGNLRRPRRQRFRFGVGCRCTPFGSHFPTALALMRPPTAPSATVTPPPSEASRNYHPDCEDAINHQINLELHVSNMYRSMASYFNSDDVAMAQVSQFFLRRAAEQNQHAERLMWLQNQRGGRTCLHDIGRSDQNRWTSSLKTIKCALRLARRANQNLLEIQQLAIEKNDTHLSDFLEHNTLHEQVIAIQDLGVRLANSLTPEGPDAELVEFFLAELTVENKT